MYCSSNYESSAIGMFDESLVDSYYYYNYFGLGGVEDE